MTTRVLAGATACWISLYLVVYTLVVHAHDGQVARWYIGLGILAVVACLAAAAGLAQSATIVTALVLTAAATLAGMLSIGLVLVPALAALVVAVTRRPAPHHREAGDTRLAQTLNGTSAPDKPGL